MLKEVKYNLSYKKINPKSFHTIYAQEEKLIQDFEFELDKENIRLEYSDKREAINARAALARYVKETKKQLRVLQRENFVFVVKEKEEANEQS